MTSPDRLRPGGTLLLIPLRGLATATSVLFAGACAASVLDSWADWNRYDVANAYVAGEPGVTTTDLVGADETSFTTATVYLLTIIAAGVLYLVWLWRARLNAERIDWDVSRLARGWTIGGWFCPVVNFWFPYRIVGEIWRTSRPDGVTGSEAVLRWWWTGWVGVWVGSIWTRAVARGEVSVDMLRRLAIAGTVATLALCVAGVFGFLVVRRITRWQEVPRPA